MDIKKNINLIVWMWKHMDGVKFTVVFSVVVGLFRIGVSLSFICISKEMIDMASSGKLTDFSVYAVALALALLFEMFFSALYVYMESQAEVITRNCLRRTLFVKAINGVWRGKEKWHTGDVVNRLEEDVRVVSNTLCSVSPGIVITSAQLVAAFLFLWYINPELAWVIAFIMPDGVIVIHKLALSSIL